MKYKKIVSAILSIMVLSSVCSCGKNSSSENDSEIVGNTEIISAENYDKQENDTDSSSVTTSSDTQKSDTNKTTSTTAKGHTAGETVSTTTAKKTQSSATNNTSAGGNSSPSSGGNSSQTPSGNTNSGGTSSPSGSSGNNNSGAANTGGNSGGSSGGSSGNSSGTSQTPSVPTETPEETYTAEIKLGSTPSYTGSNVSVDGSVVRINAGGDYIFTGKVSGGQIYVSTATEEKVTLILNGVDISNPSGPAIFIDEAKKCTIKIKEGSVNTLSDGGKDKINDGVIFSNDTLRFKGNGTLNITSGNAHGIASDDDVIIENGTYNITSVKSGIFAHDDITVSGGYLDIKGGTNGIKSKGTINISGGTSVISGGTKEEKSSVYSTGAFNYSGGYVFAAGNMVSTPTNTDIPYIVADLGASYAAGSEVEMVLDGVQMASFAPHNNFRCLMMLAPEISIGSSFYTVIDGNASESNTVNDIRNIFNIK